MELIGYEKAAMDDVQVLVDEASLSPEQVCYDERKKAVVVKLPEISVQQTVTIGVDGKQVSVQNEVETRYFDFLNQAEIAFTLKDELYRMIQQEKDTNILVSELCTMDMDEDLRKVLMEFLCAR